MGTDFDSSTAKYVIRAKIEIDGVVDKPDVVGAVFGQTEGLLGEDLDLRELQRTGRVGRIQIVVRSQGGKSKGEVVIPVSLNKTATAILAAALETVDRVGPCTAKVTLLKLEDIRGAKRRKVVSRAISILKGWEEDIAPGSEEITSAVTKASKRNVAKYGLDKLPAGPELAGSKEIIIVEGRADIINLMKMGINNTIAVEGTRVPKTVIDLTKKRGMKTIAFLDGDRGGDLILRELMQVADVDYIARAPKGKEVEELSRRQVTKALQTRIPADQALALVSGRKTKAPAKTRRQPRREEAFRKTGRTRTTRTRTPDRTRTTQARAPKRTTTKRAETPRRGRTPRLSAENIDAAYIKAVTNVKESFKAILFGSDKKVLVECGVADLAKTLESQDSVDAVIFDGVVTQRLVDVANSKKVTLLIGAAKADIEKKPATMRVATFDDVEQ
ncbi:MAG: DNA primase [Candidatus Thorarchaeota archaeon]|nr:MAG: DNA primase [Candidatus Thorarchaeota archaeon]